MRTSTPRFRGLMRGVITAIVCLLLVNLQTWFALRHNVTAVRDLTLGVAVLAGALGLLALTLWGMRAAHFNLPRYLQGPDTKPATHPGLLILTVICFAFGALDWFMAAQMTR